MTLLTTWPSVTDDSGTKTDGTIFNLALTNAMKAAIETLISSGTNPTLSPAQIIDEVVAARGSLGSLAARLAVSLNNDGTLITPQISRLYSNGSVAGAQGGAGSDGTMDSYTLAAGKLASNFQLVRVTAQGTLGATANAKTIKLFFGATSVTLFSAATNGGGWSFVAEIMRLGAATQLLTLRGNSVSAAPATLNFLVQGAPAETLSGTVLIKVTGNGTVASDIVTNFFQVEYEA